RRGGGTFELALERLSPADRDFIRQQTLPAAPARVSEDCFDDIRLKKTDDVPASGEAHEALAAVDEAIRAFMVEKGVGAVSFAVSRGGKILHDRAFGWAEADMKT